MRLIPFTCVTLLLIAASGSAGAQSGHLNIVVFTPTTEGNTYWPQVAEIMTGAAEDLAIGIEIFEFDVGDRFAKREDGVRILRSAAHVDGAILSVAFGQALPLLEVTEQRGIATMIQGPLFAEELPALGFEPRVRFSSWVGLFVEDERAKGRELGRVLISRALKAGMTDRFGDIQVVGIGGDPSWFGSALRARGLADAVAEVDGARLLQVVSTDWTESEGFDVAMGLLRRYPETSVIWAASDQLALGASRALAEIGREVGTNAVVGGLDLSLRGLEAIEAGQLTASSASTLFDYARILVYLFDYLSGSDFAGPAGHRIVLPVETATSTNAARYADLYRRHRQIDFARFSRSLNPDLAGYDFSVERLRAALEH